MAILDHEIPKYDTVMDVIEEQIARVYAQAFLGAATKSSNSSALVEELQSVIDDIIDKFPALGEMFRSAFVSEEEKQRVFDKILSGRASTVVLNFLKVLAAHQRLGILRTIVRHVKKLHEEQLGVTAVQVCAAHELSDALRKQIQDQIRASLGKEASLHVTIDREVIGGVLLRVGDMVYDGTVSNQLKMARKRMIEKSVELIVTHPERFMTGN